MLLLLLQVALAAPARHYDPADIATASEAYAAASARSGAALAEAQGKMSANSAALVDYRLALDLLGERAQPSQREELAQLERDWRDQTRAAQAFVNGVIDDFDAAFLAAVARATVAEGGAWSECAREVEAPPPFRGAPPKRSPNPDCTGEHASDRIAARIDADKALASELDAILARPWPTLGLHAAPAQPTGDAPRWIPITAFAGALYADRLRAIDQAEDQARLGVEAAIEEGDAAAQLDALKREVAEIRRATAQSRAELIAPATSAAEVSWSKAAAKGAPATGWCAKPALLGACVGEPAPLEPLLADKRVRKAASR